MGLPFVCAVYALGHLCGLDASAFLSHTSLSFPKSLKRKLTVLQETLNLPPVASDTVNRLVLERFVGAVGWCRSDRPEGLSSLLLALVGWVVHMGRGCGPPALGTSTIHLDGTLRASCRLCPGEAGAGPRGPGVGAEGAGALAVTGLPAYRTAHRTYICLPDRQTRNHSKIIPPSRECVQQSCQQREPRG